MVIWLTHQINLPFESLNVRLMAMPIVLDAVE
jgi:hypothetical protein